ncbi:MAG: hypothetical protein AAF694_11350 [Bacteroidota bacterium]
MRDYSYIWTANVFLLLGLFSCIDKPIYSLVFCQEISKVGKCEGKSIRFKRGTRVHLLFTSSEPFLYPSLHGKVFFIPPGGAKELLGEKLFDLDSLQDRIHYHIPFDIYQSVGLYSVEFYSDKEEFLYAEEVHINP